METKTSCDSENTKIGLYKGEEINFETALDVAGFGRYNIYLILACGCGMFAINSSVYAIGYVLPAAECDLNLDNSDKGLLTAVSFLGIISSLYFWGALADTTGRKKVIQISLIGAFLFGIAAVLTTVFWLFAMFLFLNGLVISGASCTMYAYLGEFHTSKRSSGAIVWSTLIMNLALFILPLTAWFSISLSFTITIFNLSYLPWRFFLLLCNLPSLFCVIAISMFPESPRFLINEGRIVEAIDVLKRMYAVNSRQSVDTFPILPLTKTKEVDANKKIIKKSALEVLENVWHQTVSLWQKEYRRYAIVTCVLQFGVFAISSGLLLWYPDILNKLSESYRKYPNSSYTVCEAITNGQLQKTEQVCDDIVNFSVYQQNMIIGIGYAIGCILVGLLIDIVGKRYLLVMNLLAPAVCCIALTFVTSSIAVDILFVVTLVPPGMCVAVINAAVVDIFPTNFRTIAVSMCLFMGRLGSVVASVATGHLLSISCNGTFYIYAALTLGCLCLSFLIPGKHSN